MLSFLRPPRDVSVSSSCLSEAAARNSIHSLRTGKRKRLDREEAPTELDPGSIGAPVEALEMMISASFFSSVLKTEDWSVLL